MRVKEETDALLEKGNRYRDKIVNRARWNDHSKQQQYTERPKHPRYQDFTIEHAAEDLIGSELIANTDITIIITDNNGKIISNSEPITKEMQNNLFVKQNLFQKRVNCRKKLKIKIHLNSKST